jgi:ligand-binding sensor protein
VQFPIFAAAGFAYLVAMKSNIAQVNAPTENHNNGFAREGADLIQSLTDSKIYQDYERAFSETTGLPVSLRPVESWQLPHRGKRHENPFCGMMAAKSRSCAACLRLQQQVSDTATNEAQTLTCELGLCDTAVPIRLGDRLVGFLQTGQIFRKRPTEAQFNRTAKLVADWGVEIETDKLKQAYFASKVLSSKQHDGVVKLLSIFAQHISMVSNQTAPSRPPSPAPSSSSRKTSPRTCRSARWPRRSTPALFTSARCSKKPPA